MAPSYKLTYFNIKGLGEPIRLMLSYLGENFEDNRIEFSQWPAIKSSMPMGQMPVLEVDGKKVCQSIAICRYLGKRAKIAGKDDWEALQIDMIVDTFNDFRIELIKYFKEENEEAKAKLKASILEEKLPFYLGKFEVILKNNNGYLANSALSWGDIYVACLIDALDDLLKLGFLENFPGLKAHQEKIFSLPGIKGWIAKTSA